MRYMFFILDISITGYRGVHYNTKFGYLHRGSTSRFASCDDNWYCTFYETFETP
jgi:hypothetical protein